jgi:uncharacterized protein YndB with AHSA1/START domain
MADHRSPIEPVDDRVLHLTVDVPAATETVYACFAESGRLERWLALVADVEPRIGGRYELFWEPADRENDSTIGCRVTALSAGELIAFQWRSPRQFKAFANSADPLTHVVVAFVPAGSGTRVHLVHSGWRSGPEWDEARSWQERAWTVGLERLRAVASRD